MQVPRKQRRPSQQLRLTWRRRMNIIEMILFKPGKNCRRKRSKRRRKMSIILMPMESRNLLIHHQDRWCKKLKEARRRA
tara:strand:- start:496 stop:732 length:237 start_codon:yes stop_codon:yes gene_type:complete